MIFELQEKRTVGADLGCSYFETIRKSPRWGSGTLLIFNYYKKNAPLVLGGEVSVVNYKINVPLVRELIVHSRPTTVQCKKIYKKNEPLVLVFDAHILKRYGNRPAGARVPS